MWKNRIEFVDMKSLNKTMGKIEEIQLDIKTANKIWRKKQEKKKMVDKNG